MNKLNFGVCLLLSGFYVGVGSVFQTRFRFSVSNKLGAVVSKPAICSLRSVSVAGDTILDLWI